MVTGEESDANRYRLTQVSPGMTEDETLDIMGYPYKTASLTTDSGVYKVWYYITLKTELGQPRLGPRNFTPLFFQDGILKGWGYQYYKEITGDKHYWERRNYLDKQKANQIEWPQKEHPIVAPPPPQAGGSSPTPGQPPSPPAVPYTPSNAPQAPLNKQSSPTQPAKPTPPSLLDDEETPTPAEQEEPTLDEEEAIQESMSENPNTAPPKGNPAPQPTPPAVPKVSPKAPAAPSTPKTPSSNGSWW